MKFANMREANQNFSSITRLIEDDGLVVVTKNGKPYLLIQKIEGEDLEDLILAKHLKVEEIARNPGQTYSLDEAKKKLGL